MRFGTIAMAFVCAMLAASPIRAADSGSSASTVARMWEAYKAKFLDPAGRIVDNANGGISHSESQGYGLLLAYLADDPGAFDLIWSFTRTELLLRDDGLAAWKWVPDKSPHVTDINNATDGDILIAYALALASDKWERRDLHDAAARMARTIGRQLVVRYQGMPLLLPGAVGFSAGDRSDGPVVNLSYWVFEAFPTFSRIAPDTDWNGLSQSGLALIRSAAFGKRRLPPDWLSVKGSSKPANGFPAEFGYNAIRIPLYLIRAGIVDRPLLERLRDGMTGDDGKPLVVDLKTGATKPLVDPGYRAIPALIGCVLDSTPLPDEVKASHPAEYYPATLQFLAVAAAAKTRPECL